MDGIESMVIRQMNARERLVACIAEIGRIPIEQAEKVATLYLGRELRAVKLDSVGGSFIIRGGHGELFERSPIRTAVEMIAAGQFKTVS